MNNETEGERLDAFRDSGWGAWRPLYICVKISRIRHLRQYTIAKHLTALSSTLPPKPSNNQWEYWISFQYLHQPNAVCWPWNNDLNQPLHPMFTLVRETSGTHTCIDIVCGLCIPWRHWIDIFYPNLIRGPDIYSKKPPIFPHPTTCDILQSPYWWLAPPIIRVTPVTRTARKWLQAS